MLERTFRCVERAQVRGVSVWRALRFFCWRWNGKPYRSDPTHSFRLSRCTLRALYYAWLRSGRVREPLLLKPNRARGRVTRGQLKSFVRLLQAPGVASTREAYRRLVEAPELHGGAGEADTGLRWRFEEAVRGPIRLGMRRATRAMAEWERARSELEQLLDGWPPPQ